MRFYLKVLIKGTLVLALAFYLLASFHLILSHRRIILEAFMVQRPSRGQGPQRLDHLSVNKLVPELLQSLVHLPDDIPLLNYSTSQKIPEKFFTGTRFCNNYAHKFIISNKGLCQGHKVFLLIGIRSHGTGYESRALIRRTWGSFQEYQGSKVIPVFLMGMPPSQKVQKAIEEENRVHRDIVQADFLDTYQNLTIKTQAVIKWLRDYCRHAQYFMMVDTDMFVDMYKLTNYLGGINKTDDTYALCYNEYQQWPRRPPKYLGHASMPEEEYPLDAYAPYCWGAAYVATIPLMNKLYIASLHTPRLRIDDVWTGILAERAGITLPSSRQYMYYVQGWQSHHSLLTRAYFTEPVIFSVWEKLDKHRQISKMWQRVLSYNRRKRKPARKDNRRSIQLVS